MDDEGEYEFQASGDSCEACQALDGTNCTTRPHENCRCQIVPATSQCTYELEAHAPVRHGAGRYDLFFGGELTVTCLDGTELGMSVEWDASGYDEGAEDWEEFAQPLIDDAVAELCQQCPEAEPERPPVA